MIILYTKDEFNASLSDDKLLCKCEICGNTFYKKKREINKVLTGKRPGKYCSKKCHAIEKSKCETVICLNCGKTFKKQLSQLKKHSHNFCSHSCSASYNNTHKEHGNRRSKLEAWLEEQLTILYPNLEIVYNGKKAIGSELDIYIPSFELAFELNGIFHYEPIFGSDKLNRIQNNDKHKSQSCLKKQITLISIDVSSFRYFKQKGAQIYLNIIANIINKKINISKN